MIFQRKSQICYGLLSQSGIFGNEQDPQRITWAKRIYIYQQPGAGTSDNKLHCSLLVLVLRLLLHTQPQSLCTEQRDSKQLYTNTKLSTEREVIIETHSLGFLGAFNVSLPPARPWLTPDLISLYIEIWSWKHLLQPAV